MNYIISKVEKKDLEKLLELFNFTWIKTYSYFPQKAVQEIINKHHTIQHFLPFIDDKDYCFLKAKYNNQIIGFSLAFAAKKNDIINNTTCWDNVKKTEDINNNVLFIDKIYLHPDFQRMGIGKHLLDHTLKTFSDLKTVWLRTEDKNQAGISFYLKNGFKIIKTFKNNDVFEYTAVILEANL